MTRVCLSWMRADPATKLDIKLASIWLLLISLEILEKGLLELLS